VRPDRALLKVD